MEALGREGYRTLGSAELSDRPAPGPAVVLTFDDGYDALARHAFPVLADLGLRALVFVVTDFVGRDNDWDVHYGWRRFRHLSWDDLGRWQGSAIEVHSHGATHARLTWLPDGQVEDELGRSRETIARRLGTAPAGLAYPFGAVDARVRTRAAAAGYALGFAGPGRARGTHAGDPDPLMLYRRPVYAWDAFAPPRILGEGAAGRLAMAAARLAHGAAVATSVIRRLRGAPAAPPA
jgi:peptidoglycan/xylan/chitin deacetylase (PgdA/CDA1 family)